MIKLKQLHDFLEAYGSVEGGTRRVTSYFYEGMHLFLPHDVNDADEGYYVNLALRKMAILNCCSTSKMTKKVNAHARV